MQEYLKKSSTNIDRLFYFNHKIKLICKNINVKNINAKKKSKCTMKSLSII